MTFSRKILHAYSVRRYLVVAVVLLLLATQLELSRAADISLTQPHARQAGEVFRDCSDCPEMVVVPPGHFLMGSSDADTERDFDAIKGEYPDAARVGASRKFATEHPQHPVSLDKPFAVGKYPVTWPEFRAFLQETGYAPDGSCRIYADHIFPAPPGSGWQNPGFAQSDRSPAVCVSWADAHAYIAWLNKKIGGVEASSADDPYRLPSEAEWEYMARAGTITARWWGDSLGSGNADCTGCGSQWDDVQPAPVGSFRANPFGLYDIIGNVFQWTADCWNESYSGAPGDGAAWIAGDCSRPVARGGSWISDADSVRSAGRTSSKSNSRLSAFGFRLTRTLK